MTPIARAVRPIVVSLVACLVCAASARAQAPAHLWSQRFGDAGTQNGYAVATDAAGNVYLAGQFQGTANFGGGVLTSLGGGDIFLAKFSPAGAYLWAKRYGDASFQVGWALATDASGNVFMAGHFVGSVDFGGGPLSSTAGGQDVFLAKLDANGSHLWSKRFGDSDTQTAADLATDASGNVFFAGFFSGSIDFGGGGLSGSQDIFLAKLDANGSHVWSQDFGDGFMQSCQGVAADGSGNVYICGQYEGSVNFGGLTLTPNDEADVYLAKFNAAGAHQWSQSFGSGFTETAGGVATDPAGNVYFAGTFPQSINLGGATLFCAGGDDIFLAKFNSTGAHQWSKKFGDPGGQNVHDVAASSSGVCIVGDFSSDVNFGGGTLLHVGGQDIYLAKFSPAGVHHGSQRFGDSDDQYGLSVAASSASDVVIGGYYLGNVNFGGSALPSQGAADIYIAKFGPAPTGAGDLPRANSLALAAWPNPFNPSTVVRYELPRNGRATIRIYDARGARVTTLVDGETTGGLHTMAWNGTDAAGNRVGSGVYFARLNFGSDERTFRLVLVK